MDAFRRSLSVKKRGIRQPTAPETGTGRKPGPGVSTSNKVDVTARTTTQEKTAHVSLFSRSEAQADTTLRERMGVDPGRDRVADVSVATEESKSKTNRCMTVRRKR